MRLKWWFRVPIESRDTQSLSNAWVCVPVLCSVCLWAVAFIVLRCHCVFEAMGSSDSCRMIWTLERYESGSGFWKKQLHLYHADQTFGPFDVPKEFPGLECLDISLSPDSNFRSSLRVCVTSGVTSFVMCCVLCVDDTSVSGISVAHFDLALCADATADQSIPKHVLVVPFVVDARVWLSPGG
jgi:hypothetical protein